MVEAQLSGGYHFRLQSGGGWFESSLCRCVVSLGRKLYSTLSLFTHKCIKWVLMHSIQEAVVAIFLVASCFPNRSYIVSSGLVSHLACKQTLPFKLQLSPLKADTLRNTFECLRKRGAQENICKHPNYSR